MGKKNNELNGFLIFLLILSVLRNVPNLITAVISSQIYTDMYVIIQIVFVILLIIALIGILCKNKYALIGLFLLGISNSVIAFCMGKTGAGIGQLLVIILWAALFCLRKNGKSAWKAILFSDKQEENETEENGNSIEGNLVETLTDSSTPSEMRVNYDNYLIKDSQGVYNERHNESILSSEGDRIIKDNDDIIKDKQEESSGSKIFDDNQNELKGSENSISDGKSNSQNDKHDSPTKGLSKNWIIGCVCLIILIIGFFILKRWFVKTPEARFEEAKNLVFKHNNVEEAIPILIDLLNENDSSSGIKTMLGIAYLGRKGDKLDSQKGLEYLRDAANKDTLAIRILIDIYRGKKINGNTFTNDIELKKYAELAIKKKCYLGEAYYRLGNMYANQEQYLNAYYYWQKATEYNVPSAYINIGKMYYLGYGCPIDYEKAREYFLRANEISPDNATTLYFLGMMYKYGLGFPKDLSKAKEYLKRSANNGNERAQRAYAEMEINN